MTRYATLERFQVEMDMASLRVLQLDISSYLVDNLEIR